MNERPANSRSEPGGYQPLVLVLAAACAGLLIDRVADVDFGWWWLLAALGWAGWYGLWRREASQGAACLLLVSVISTAGAWHHCRWSLFAADELGLFAGEQAAPTAVEVRALSGPRRMPAPPFDVLRTIGTPERTKLEIEILAIRDVARWRPASGVATLSIDGHLLGVRPGDRLRVFGQFGSLRGPANPGEFDFAAQARLNRRLCWLSSQFPECVTTLHRGSRWSWRSAVDFFRTRGDSLLWRNVGRGQSGLAAAMFLGARQELDPDQTQAFLETGTIHLLVISGLNVGILAGLLFVLMQIALVPRTWALAVVAVACVFYALTTDAQPPVVRATVMVLIACLAMVLGRRVLGYNSLAAAGLVVLAINPGELFQAGTQLSFLSVATLVWIAQRRIGRRELDPLERLIARTRPWHVRFMNWWLAQAKRALLASLLIWLVICPLVMSRFHLVSPVAVVLGPLVGVPVTLAMSAGFGIFALGWIAPPVADALGAFCDWNLSFLQWSVSWARTLRGNHFWVSGPGDWWLVGFYGALGLWVLAPWLAPPRRWCLGLLAGWSAVGLLAPIVALPHHDQLRCTFLSVGHGAAVVVQLPGGQTLLYDAGRLGSPVAASRAVSGYLWSQGITHLDAVVISHADADHYNALPTLIDQFSIGAVYVSPVMFEQPSRALVALREAIQTSGVPLREVWSGDRLSSSGAATIDVLHPPRRGVLGSDNANSIVLAITYAHRRVLLTGDLESPGLDDVLAEESLDVDVLLAPHHGSAFSDPPGIADWSTPEWTIVSGGTRDKLEAVASAYAARGSRVLHTSDRGAVSVVVDDGELSVDCWRDEAR